MLFTGRPPVGLLPTATILTACSCSVAHGYYYSGGGSESVVLTVAVGISTLPCSVFGWCGWLRCRACGTGSPRGKAGGHLQRIEPRRRQRRRDVLACGERRPLAQEGGVIVMAVAIEVVEVILLRVTIG